MIHFRTLQFTVVGEPVGKGRPRFVRATGRTFTPEKTARYENLVRLSFVQKYPHHEPIDTGIELSIESYFKIPESWSKTKKKQAGSGELLKITKPDVDNIVKSVCDGLNGVAWTDDSRIYSLHAVKHYAAQEERPRVEVTIKHYEEE